MHYQNTIVGKRTNTETDDIQVIQRRKDILVIILLNVQFAISFLINTGFQYNKHANHLYRETGQGVCFKQ